MAVKKGFYWSILACVLIVVQTNASLISVAPHQNSSQLIQYTKSDTGYLPVGSDDILESVHLTNEAPSNHEEFHKVEEEDDYYANQEREEYDLGEYSANALEARDANGEETTETPESSSSTEASTAESSTSEVPSSTTTDPELPTELCDTLLTSDTELQYPTKDASFDKEHNISWCFELQSGPGVDIYLEYLNLDPQSDYLLIMAGHGEDDDNKGNLISGTHTNLTFKIIDTNKAYIFLSHQGKDEPENYGFKLRVSSHGEFPSSTTPPSTTVPTYLGRMKTITKSLTVAQELQNDTDIWDKTLRNALVESTNLWREAQNFSEFLEVCRRENVIFERVSPCPESWPDHLNCVRLEFGIPLNKTDYDGELDERLDSLYELSEGHLEEVWQGFAIEKLSKQGMTEYFLPNSTFVLLTWISISVSIVIVFCIVLYAIWKSDLFKGYKRMKEETESEKSPEDDKKQNDISMYPTPFLYGEDEFPAEFSHEYGYEHDMGSMHDQDTTLYDVRTPPPVKQSVKFATEVDNISDVRSGTYTNPFALELEASDTYQRHGYRDSEC